METPIIIAIILLIVLIAGGIYMLTRNPAPPRSDGPPPSDSAQGVDAEVDRYDVGGEHVAAGDAQASTVESPYDQESDTGHTVYEHDGETHVEPATVDETVSQDTATGTEVEIVEEEPVVRATEDLDPVDAPADPYDHGDREQVTYGAARTEDYAAETTYAQPVPHEQDLEDDDERDNDEAIVVVEEDEPVTDNDVIVVVEEGEPVTDDDAIVVVADEEVVVDPPESEHFADDDDLNGRTAEELIDERAGDHHDKSGGSHEDRTPDDQHDGEDSSGGVPRVVAGGATVMGAAGPADAQESSDSDARLQEHHAGDSDGEASENLGPEAGEGDAAEHEVDQGHPGPVSQDGDAAEHEVDQGHPGPVSQDGDDASYHGSLTHDEGVENPGPEEGEGDIAPPSDQGHPGHDSHPDEETTDDHDVNRDVEGHQPEGHETEGHEVDEAGNGVQEVQLVDPEDYSVASPEDVSHDGHDENDEDHGHAEDHEPAEDREDRGDHHHAEHSDDHHLAEDHDGDDHEQAAAHDHVEDHGQVQEVESVDVDDYAASEMAPDRDAGLDSDESTSAMVDLENEEPVTPGSDAQTPADSREGNAPGHGATAAVAAERGAADKGAGGEGADHDGAAGAGTEAPADSQDVDTGLQGEPLTEDPDDVESVPEEGPYGPGSAMPHDDGTGPSGFEVKGNAGSMLFHTPDSPAYEDCRAEVWFDGEDAAREAGFAHWDRKRR